jgi:protein TonB
MKYCEFDGFRYPDEKTTCHACGRPLVEVSSIKDLPENTTFALTLLCCPSSVCSALVAPAKANFCAACGSKLQPISYELWMGKFIKPALEERPADVLLDPSDLLRPVVEMGLSVNEAKQLLDAALEERIGVRRDVLDHWLQDTTDLLKKEEKYEVVLRRATREAKSLGIAPIYVEMILQRLAPTVSMLESSQHQPLYPATPTTQQTSDIIADLPYPTTHDETGEPTENILEIPDMPAAFVRSQEPDIIEMPYSAQDKIREEDKAPVVQEGNRKEVVRERDVTERRVEPRRINIRDLSAAKLFLGIITVAALLFVIYRALPSLKKRSDDMANNQNVSNAGSDNPSDGGSKLTDPTARQFPANTDIKQDGIAETKVDESGLVFVYANVDGVRLIVDNGNEVTTLSRGHGKELSLPPGQHFFRASKQGYQPWAQSLKIEAGARLSLQVSLAASGSEDVSQAESVPLPQPSTGSAQGQVRNEQPQTSYPTPTAPSISPQPKSEATSRSEISTSVAQPTPQQQTTPRATDTPNIFLGPSRSPKIRTKAQPDWPESAFRERETGSVSVLVSVDKYGNVTSAKAIQGPQQLQQAAVRAALRCRFDPALQNGQPIEGQVTIIYTFSIHGF